MARTNEQDAPAIALRGLAPGDLGWVIQRKGEIYADEFGWNMEFEGLVAQIAADYLKNHKPGREQAWIATVDGARAGAIFCCQRDEETAQLRLLFVEPWARGMGIGSRLVDECIGFAKAAGYKRITLWTNSILHSARRIYEAAGFRLESEKDYVGFGQKLTGQDWTREL